MKGIELPVNTLIIIVIAVIVLVAIIALFTGVWSPGAGGVNLEAVKNTACQKLVSMGCKDTNNPKDIQITNFDANKDGKTEAGNTVDGCTAGTGKDNLMTLCCNYYGITGATKEADCRKLCGCP